MGKLLSSLAKQVAISHVIMPIGTEKMIAPPLGIDIQHLPHAHTAQHTEAAEVPVSLILPPGFKAASGFQGFEHPRYQTQIRINLWKGQSYRESAHRFGPSLVPDGQQLLQEEWARIGPFDAKYLKFTLSLPKLLSQQSEQIVSQVFALGNARHLVVLTASYPQRHEAKVGSGLEASLKSVCFRPELQTPEKRLSDQLAFDLRPEEVGLRLAQFEEKNLARGKEYRVVFTRDGLEPSALGEKFLIIERQWPLPHPRTALQRIFQNNFFSTFEWLETRELEIDGLRGLETFAIECAVQGPTGCRLAYLLLLVDEECHYEMRAWANDDQISHLATFRQVSQSFARRYQPPKTG